MEKIIFTREKIERNHKRYFDKQPKSVYRKGTSLWSMPPCFQVPRLPSNVSGFD